MALYRKKLRLADSEIGERLDSALARQLTDVSRTQLTKWIRDGSITVAGHTVKPNYRLNGGEVIEVAGEFQPRQDWETAVDLSVKVVFEDADILVIDKSSGLVVHPGAATVAPTLANGLLSMRPSLSELPRVGIVHRLDKDTTGLMVIAASELARVRLVEALSKRAVSRSYVAVVNGHVRERRVIDLPIGRSSRDRTRQTVRHDGRNATTMLTPIANFRAHALVNAELQTGRTHQIRVHAARIGLPIVGDKKYGIKSTVPDGSTPQLRSMLVNFPRQALHARRLSFNHPRSGEPMTFNSPLPTDLCELVQVLRKDVGQHG